MTDHRQLGVDLFNHVWTLLEQAERTADEDDTMLHAAHASRHHWGHVGEPRHLARGEWQISRVYAVLDRGEPALHHARRCLGILERSGDGEEWDVPFAHEAVARAALVAGERETAEYHLSQARQLGAQIEDADDREHLEAALAELTQ
ncbi:MAG: hypothetical protein WKF41_07565 [Gaiellaceae bacterium]